MIELFKKLEYEWGPLVLMHHLERETTMSVGKLKQELESMKKQGIIKEPRDGCFLRLK